MCDTFACDAQVAFSRRTLLANSQVANLDARCGLRKAPYNSAAEPLLACKASITRVEGMNSSSSIESSRGGSHSSVENSPRQICFESANKIGGVFQGDSGGPVLCLDYDERWNVVGAFSKGPLCLEEVMVDSIGNYANVKGLFPEIMDLLGSFPA